MISPPTHAEIVVFSDGSYLPGKVLPTTEFGEIPLQIQAWTLTIPEKQIAAIEKSPFRPKETGGLQKTFRKLPALLGDLASPDPPKREQAFLALETIPGEATVYLLIQLMQEKGMGQQAARTLYRLSAYEKLAVPEKMGETLRSIRHFEARHIYLIEFLGTIRSRDAFSVLDDLTRHAHRPLAIAALKALGEIGGSSASEILVDSLEHPEEIIVRHAVLALGRTETIENVPVLIPLLNHPSQTIASSALWSLQKLTDQPLPANADLWKNWWQRISDDWDTLSALHETLQTGHEPEVLNALERLAQIRSPTSISPVIELLDHPSPAVRRTACLCLWHFPLNKVGPALMQKLDDPEVVETAYRLLRKMTGWDLPPQSALWQRWWEVQRDTERSDTSFVQILSAATAPFALRILAAQEIGARRQSHAIPALISLLQDGVADHENWEERDLYLAAIHSLRILKAEQAVPLFIDLLTCDEKRIGQASYIALLQITRQQLPNQAQLWRQWLAENRGE